MENLKYVLGFAILGAIFYACYATDTYCICDIVGHHRQEKKEKPRTRLICVNGYAYLYVSGSVTQMFDERGPVHCKKADAGE